jgi:hypothetical protein
MKQLKGKLVKYNYFKLILYSPQCMMILSAKGNDIFAGVPAGQYERVIKLLEHAILSTGEPQLL